MGYNASAIGRADAIAYHSLRFVKLAGITTPVYSVKSSAHIAMMLATENISLAIYPELNSRRVYKRLIKAVIECSPAFANSGICGVYEVPGIDRFINTEFSLRKTSAACKNASSSI